MRLDGRRESSNVDDRRRMTGGAKAGLGLGGIVIIALITFMTGGNLGDVVQNVGSQMINQSQNVTEQGDREFTQEEQELAKFSSQILAGTEDVWTKVFQEMGRTYRPPKMVLYTGSVQTGCGQGSAQVGPFYCSADQSLYIDLSFFTTMKKQLGADGDFASAADNGGDKERVKIMSLSCSCILSLETPRFLYIEKGIFSGRTWRTDKTS